MTALVARFRAMPRALQWAVVALAAFVLYFAVVEPVLERRAALAARAQDKEAALLTLARGTKEADDIALGIRRFGLVLPPGDPRERADAFNRRINEVLKNNKVTDHTGTTRTVPLSQGPLNSFLESGSQRADRVIREIQFEASPETLAAVLADLERSPEVATVAKVQMRKSDEGSTRDLRATVTVEAWVATARRSAR